jgi:hypothetical protein
MNTHNKSRKDKKINFYRYESWDKDIPVNDVLIKLDKLGEDDWEVVSHSHSPYGMSVILKKQRMIDPLK